MAILPESTYIARRNLVANVEGAARDLVLTPDLDRRRAIQAVKMLEDMLATYDRSVRLVHDSSSPYYAERDLSRDEANIAKSAKHLVATAHTLYNDDPQAAQ